MYCTRSDLQTRFGETELIHLSDRDNAGVINDAVLAQAIADADAEINGYLTAYTLPLAIVPANLAGIACDIVRYRLYDDQLIDVVIKRYEQAIRYLEKVAKGAIMLPPDAVGNVEPKAIDDVAYQAADTVFSGTGLSGF